MATLPDLDTANIGFCAYWNAIDQGGVGTIDPEEALSDGNINEYTLYDNGWEASSYTSVTGREFKIRAKSDGWFVAYMDRSESFATNAGNQDNVRGPWDLANNWTNSGNNANFVSNSLSSAIQSAASQLSNWDSITFNHSDVGLYNFEYSSATGITGMSTAASTYESNQSDTCGVLYTEGTTVDWAAAFGSGNGDAPAVDFEGSSVIDNSGGYGALDLLAAGLIPNAATEYQMYMQSNAGYQDSASATGCVLFIWE